MSLEVGDKVFVVANVDYQGLFGTISEIDSSKKDPIKVEFNEGWCWYSESELKFIPTHDLWFAKHQSKI